MPVMAMTSSLCKISLMARKALKAL